MKKDLIISLDTETTGLDFWHGVQPFMVCILTSEEDEIIFEWDVDVDTRRVKYNEKDLQDILKIISRAQKIILHNAVFDYHALNHISKSFSQELNNIWDWNKVDDTLLMSHMVDNTIYTRNLTYLSKKYLDKDIEEYEIKLDNCVKECRRIAKRRGIKILTDNKEDNESNEINLPSTTSKFHKAELWLPKYIANTYSNSVKEDGRYDEYSTICRDYATQDILCTYLLYFVFITIIRERRLENIYNERRKLLRIVQLMQHNGVSFNKLRLNEMKETCEEESDEYAHYMLNIAKSKSYQLTIPDGNINSSLANFIEHYIKPSCLTYSKKTHKPLFNIGEIKKMIDEFDENSEYGVFLRSITEKRKRDTSIAFINSYSRFAHHINEKEAILHPNINLVKTVTLRCSSSNPNEQNICVDGSTEILTDTGWIRADELTYDVKVAQYWKHDESIDFTKFELHTPNYIGNMHYITTENNINMMLTPDHRCLLKKRKSNELIDVKAKYFKEDHKHIHAGVYVGGNVSLSLDQVICLCAIQADGSYVYTNSSKQGIKFVFKKKRKIDRLIKALNRLKTQFTIKVKKDCVRIYIKKESSITKLAMELMPNKTFDKWLLNLDRDTLDLFKTEFFFWDGDYTRKACYFSSDNKSADWVQIIWTLSNWKSNLANRMPNSVWSKKRMNYVNVVQNVNYSMTSNFNRELIPWNDKVYCVSVPSSYMIIRREGKVSITGNCKREGFSLRKIFGPNENREWYSLDAKNVELRIPAYYAGETDMIKLFEKPDDPPYFGSNHLLVCHILYPEKFEECIKDGVSFKDRYKATFYSWTKNGNFAVQYGAMEESGTADRAYHMVGAQAKVQNRFKEIKKLNLQQIDKAQRLGYIETIPDKSIDPKQGYRLYIPRRKYERGIKPTLPLNYFIQGTAMWYTLRGMVKCQEQLDIWRKEDGFSGFITMQVHDEIVFDFPKSRIKPDKDRWNKSDKKDGNNCNLWRIKTLKSLIESTGNDINIPIPVGVAYHETDWHNEVVLS